MQCVSYQRNIDDQFFPELFACQWVSTSAKLIRALFGASSMAIYFSDHKYKYAVIHRAALNLWWIDYKKEKSSGNIWLYAARSRGLDLVSTCFIVCACAVKVPRETQLWIIQGSCGSLCFSGERNFLFLQLLVTFQRFTMPKNVCVRLYGNSYGGT